VLSIGVAAYDKGTIHTIQAMERLWAQGCDATLILIASTTMAQFERLYESLPAATRARIKLLKAVPHATKLDALAAAELFVLPSRTDSFGIVYLEAWRYTVPVIGARAGGVPDVIDDGTDGFLVRFGDVGSLAAKIELLLRDRDLAATMGRRGHAKVLRELTFDQKYGAMRAVYAELGL
jgi:glycosyltransferase involved in cell wall biosynthesis